MILGNQILEEAMQVGPSRWIGILVDHEAGTGVLHEDGGNASRDPAGVEQRLHLVGDLIGPLPRRGECEALGNGDHDSERNEATPISNQPAIRSNPPMGVIAPIHEILVTARA